MDSLPIPLIKIENDTKLEKGCVKNKFKRDPTSENSDKYEFKMALFDNRKPEIFLLFVRNFKIMLDISGTPTDNEKFHYLHNILCVEALCQFDHCFAQVGSTTMEISTQSFWVWVLIFPF